MARNCNDGNTCISGGPGRKEVLTKRQGMSTSGENSNSEEQLPEEVQERIVSRMQFPSLFKARALSRNWYFKFAFPLQRQSSKISFPSDSFQKHVMEMSAKWATYCPILLSKTKILGFDTSLSIWRSVVTLRSHSIVATPMMVSCAGSLVCSVYNLSQCEGYAITVTNVLSKRESRLPPESSEYFSEPCHCRIIPMGSHAYQVILIDLAGRDVFLSEDDNGKAASEDENEDSVSEDDNGEAVGEKAFVMTASVYDSSKRTWTTCSKKVQENPYTSQDSDFFENAAYVDGTFHGLVRTFRKHPKGASFTVHSFHLKDNKWGSSLIEHNIVDLTGRFDDKGCFAKLLHCGGKLILCVCSKLAVQESKVAIDGDLCIFCTRPNSILICEIDLDAVQVKKVSTGPDNAEVAVGGLPGKTLSNIMNIFAHRDVIYFGRISSSCPVLTFNVCTSKWGCLPAAANHKLGSVKQKIWAAGAFEPGLNPFAEV